MTDSPFPPQEWELMLKAPVVVFLFVGAAEGEISGAEVAAFQKMLGAADAFKSKCLGHAMRDAAPRFSLLLAEALVTGNEAGHFLADVKACLERRLSAEEALLFKRSLLFVGRQIADVTRRNGEYRPEKLAALSTLACLLGLQTS